MPSQILERMLLMVVGLVLLITLVPLISLAYSSFSFSGEQYANEEKRIVENIKENISEFCQHTPQDTFNKSYHISYSGYLSVFRENSSSNNIILIFRFLNKNNVLHYYSITLNFNITIEIQSIYIQGYFLSYENSRFFLRFF